MPKARKSRTLRVRRSNREPPRWPRSWHLHKPVRLAARDAPTSGTSVHPAEDLVGLNNPFKPSLNLRGLILLPCPRDLTPAWISPIVTAAKCKSSSLTLFCQAKTGPCGRIRLSSDTTFVSRRYITPGKLAAREDDDGLAPDIQFAARAVNQQQVLEHRFAARFSICPSFNGTSTAVAAPRLVISCGPCSRQISNISLKRAFASWTGQLFIKIPLGQN